ncbi:Fe-S cluster assembly protein SufD [Candidatus Woesearchaeota archaeon]|nr:Fe-S cluster assembly protein SufD [Candidatus Woesearchaeota archaeon]
MLKSHEMNANEPAWLSEKRKGALELFRKTPMPSFVYGINMKLDFGLDLENLDFNDFQEPLREISGKNSGIKIINFNDAIKNNEPVLREKFMSAAKINDKFSALHYAFLNSLTLIIIPKNFRMKEPLEISSVMKKGILLDHTIIITGENSEATIVEDVSSEKGSIYRSRIVEIYAGDNSTVNYGDVQLLDESAVNYTVKKAVAGRDSTINWMDCIFGSKITLSEVTTILEGQGSSTNNHGAFFSANEQQFDIVTNSIHKAPNTFSDIVTKGAVSGRSKAMYRGLVKIHENAAGSNGYQKEDTLILSSDATSDSIPNLEIGNNDVKCSHGATIGRIDREKLFYMRSRGLSEQEASMEYVKGFFEGLILKIRIQKLRDSMHSLIERKMVQ